jgi:hypothetical protein
MELREACTMCVRAQTLPATLSYLGRHGAAVLPEEALNKWVIYVVS